MISIQQRRAPEVVVERNFERPLASAVPEPIARWLASKGSIGVFATTAASGDGFRRAEQSYPVMWDDIPEEIREECKRYMVRKSPEGMIVNADCVLFEQSLEANQHYKEQSQRRWRSMVSSDQGRSDALTEAIVAVADAAGVDRGRLAGLVARQQIPELDSMVSSPITVGADESIIAALGGR